MAVKKAQRIAVCPGSYDPITNGHIDIIERAASLFDKVIVAVALNPAKSPLMPMELRVELATKALQKYKNVDIQPFSDLLVEFASRSGASVIVKGLRAVSDFDHEFQMAQYNRGLRPEIETVFIMSHHKYMFLSSSMVKEIVSNGGSAKNLVTPEIERKLKEIFKATR